MRNIVIHLGAEPRALIPHHHQNPVVPSRKQRGTGTTQHRAGLGLEPWPEPAELVGLGCISLPPALSPTAGTPTPLSIPRPSAARRPVQWQGVQHLALFFGVLSHLCVTGVVLPTLQLSCLHAVHAPLPAQQHLAGGQQRGLCQPGISHSSRRDAESPWGQRDLQQASSEPLHQVQEGALEKSHLVQVSKEDP